MADPISAISSEQPKVNWANYSQPQAVEQKKPLWEQAAQTGAYLSNNVSIFNNLPANC